MGGLEWVVGWGSVRVGWVVDCGVGWVVGWVWVVVLVGWWVVV